MGKGRTELTIDELAIEFRDLSPDSFPHAPEHPSLSRGLNMVYRPQTWWLDEYEDIHDRVILRQLESMDTSWPLLMDEWGIEGATLPTFGAPGYNNWARKGDRSRPLLTRKGRDAVLDRYADDLELWRSVDARR